MGELLQFKRADAKASKEEGEEAAETTIDLDAIAEANKKKAERIKKNREAANKKVTRDYRLK